MAWLEVDGLRKSFAGRNVLTGASFSIERGEFFTIVGPTNAGKSTLLKTIAGIERENGGSVSLGGLRLTGLEPRQRHLSLLFQNVALFPGLTGFENIAFPLRVARRPEAEIRNRVEEVAELLRVGHVLSRLPRTYSGGEQQRVAIGRAIIQPGNLLMLDEPLTNLDARIRTALRLAFKRMHLEAGQTILYVTHDQVEALSLSDRVGVFRDGRFEQIGPPREIYGRPATDFVSQFIGALPMNLLPARIEREDGHFRARGDGFAAEIVGLPPDAAPPADGAIGLRPEDVEASPVESPATPFAGDVTWVEQLGSHNILDARIGANAVKVRLRPDHPVRQAGRAWFGFKVAAHHVLDRETGRFIAVPAADSDGTGSRKETLSCA